MDQVERDRCQVRAPTRGRASSSPVYAALDLGTNNCRLLMAVSTGDGFRVIDAFSRTTRLGEGLANTGMLSEGAINRTIAAMRTCAQKMERRGVTRFRAVATEACRRAGNGKSFMERVRAETGLSLDVISAEEEASLAMAGCSPLLDRKVPYALVLDIGGGSTELVHVSVSPRAGCDEVLSVVSLPLGVVTLAEERGASLDDPAGYATAVADVVAMLRPFDFDGRLSRLIASGEMQMLGTSGTVTTLAGVHLNLARYERSAVDGLVMDFQTIQRVSRVLLAAGANLRAAYPWIGLIWWWRDALFWKRCAGYGRWASCGSLTVACGKGFCSR